MPRANRYFLPGHVWHITHRCHKKDFLLKFGKDRDRWRFWLFESRKRFGLCVLDYIITSNHIHLLVQDRGQGEIARSMQLVAGRTAQEYNFRKKRKGAYWEDRYHATAIQSNEHLSQCLAYIDLNMVRAGKVKHPEEWRWSGYREIQHPMHRYRIVDIDRLCALFDVSNHTELKARHQGWIEHALCGPEMSRKEHLSQAIAVGSEAYVDQVKAELGFTGLNRKKVSEGDDYVLRESKASYKVNFKLKNSILSE